MPRAVANTHASKQVFRIDCSPTSKVWTESAGADEPVLFDQLKEYLAQHIKVDGRVGNLGDKVKLDSKEMTIVITSFNHYSKSYFKYLTKRFLKSKNIRDHLRVIASSKNAYQIKFVHVAETEE